jgi:hypothetical protein
MVGSGDGDVLGSGDNQLRLGSGRQIGKNHRGSRALHGSEGNTTTRCKEEHALLGQSMDGHCVLSPMGSCGPTPWIAGTLSEIQARATISLIFRDVVQWPFGIHQACGVSEPCHR